MAYAKYTIAGIKLFQRRTIFTNDFYDNDHLNLLGHKSLASYLTRN
jgi:hypothetical protein